MIENVSIRSHLGKKNLCGTIGPSVRTGVVIVVKPETFGKEK